MIGLAHVDAAPAHPQPTVGAKLTAGSSMPGWLRLDPRTKLAGLCLVNAIAMGITPFPIILATGTVVAALFATARRGRGWWTGVLTFAGSAGVVMVLPRVWPSAASVAITVVFYWFCRFSVAVMMAGYVIGSTGSGEFVAALRAMRVPRQFVIVVTVMLRFIPVTVAEIRAIHDAMRLRGLFPGPWSVVLHPVRATEYLLVPLLSSVTRISDDLAAAGAIRGLGSTVRPTSLVSLRVRFGDGLILMVFAGLAVAAWIPRVGA